MDYRRYHGNDDKRKPETGSHVIKSEAVDRVTDGQTTFCGLAVIRPPTRTLLGVAA